VDFPDVNIRLCKIAQKAGVRICYYISPQVWAWRWRRIYKIAAVVDRMMTIFPFEEKLYSDVGVRAYFVGHTMVRDIPQNMDKHKLRSELGIRNQNYLVTLAPGSRRSEIIRVLPIMCDAARSHLTHCPDTEFVVPLASSHLKELIENILRESQLEAKIVMGEASRTMGASDYGLVTSGTATLQAALAKMPHAVVYIIDKFSWFLATKILMPLVMDPNIHVAIANMLCIKNPSESENPIDIMIERGYRINCLGCGRPLLVPELLQNHATTENLAEWLDRFKSDPNLRIAMEAAFSKLREVLEPHASNPSPSDILIELITEKHREISLLNS
ncbi:MAG: lipid-A-disaccharide synthase, partial [Desulfomonilaceae bacterium]